MKQAKRILSAFLALVMLLGLLPTLSFAAGDWAYVRWENGEVTNYATFRAAWDAATSSGNNNTVGLYNNWDGGRFCVPEGKTVTLELNGYVLTRDRNSSTGDGEVLYVGKNATLNVYGGSKANPAYGSKGDANQKTHNVWVYVAAGDRYSYNRSKETLYGGIINGGNSDNGGGGIHMKESAKVYLYYVTIAGNKADKSGASYGDGGGIEMNNKYGYVYMEDSQIIYNAARYDGGGIHVDSDYCRVDMVRSRIDHNVADDNGGGIYVDGDHFVLKGDAEQILDPEAAIVNYAIKDWTGAYNYFPDVNALGSSISYNCVFDTEDGGGGIYMDNEYGLIEGVNFFGNITTEDCIAGDGDGGAIYLDEEEITIRSCNILRNKADDVGGGIYVRGDDNINDYDDNTVDSCTVCKNLAWDPDGAGGGIFVSRYCDLILSGKTIVRGNVSRSFGDDNLFLSTDGAAVNAYLAPSLSPGADVHVRISEYNAGHGNQISRDPGTYDSTLFSYDNDPENKHIGWDRNWNDRYLKVMDGAKPANPETLTFTPTNPDGRTSNAGVYTVDGIDYPIIKGVFSYPSFPDDYADIENVFYYSDGFFAGDAKTYNAQLATASMCLAGAAGYSNEYGKDDHTGGMSSDYLDKSQNFRQFVSDIGCADADIYVNDFNTRKPDADTIGVGLASKDITIGSTQKKLVIIGVRGMGYEKEWISNMTLGATGEAAGWASAANQVFAELKGYLARKGIDGTSENTIFWIAGYSRGGATANLTAKRIVDAYDHNGTHTFAYPLEAPKGGVASAKVAGNNYNCIHNVVNQNDIVPWTGTTEMGLIRYGVDHYIPGSTNVSANPTEGSDHILKDNSAWDVTGNTNGHGGSEDYLTTDYWKQEVKMINQLKAVNPDIVFDDYFHRATVEYVDGGQFQWNRLIEESSLSASLMPDTEAFVKVFFEKLQEWAFKYGTDGNEVTGSYTNPRTYFATYPVSNGKSFQQAAASAAGVIFGMAGEQKNALIGSMNGFLDRMKGKYDFWKHLDTSGVTDADLIEDITSIWQQLTNPDSTAISKGARSIKDFMSEEDFKALDDNYMALLFPIMCFVAEDWSENNQRIVGTAAYNIPRLIANHYPEVTHSWLRSYDYLYENDGTNPVVMADSAKTAPSAVALEITHKDGTVDTVIPVNNQDITVHVDDVVRMLPSNSGDVNKGEAIYYQFLDGPAATWSDRGTHAYAEPFRLWDMLDTHAWQGTFKFSVIAAHNGVRLEPVTVRLVLEGNAFLSVPTTYTNDAYQYTELPLEIGKSQAIDAIPPGSAQNMRFLTWEVYTYDTATGTIGEAISPDKYIEYFGTDFHAEDETITVTNRKGVSARFVPIYEKIVSSIDVSFGGGRRFQDIPGMYYLPGYIDWKDSDAAAVEGRSTIFWTVDKTKGEFYATFSLTLSGIETFDGVPELEIDSDSLYDYIGQLNYSSVNGTVSGKTLTVTATFYTNYSNEQYDYDWYYDDQAVELYDLNLNQQIGVYHFHNEGTVTAPFLPDMEFVHWQDGSTDPTITVTTINMKAYYRPIVNKVDLTLDLPLTAGEQLPALSEVKVKVSNNWRLDSGVSLAWNSTETFADYNKVYAARITVEKANLTGTNLSVSGSPSVSLAGAFAFADSVDLSVKSADGTVFSVTNYVFSETDDEILLDLVFGRTAKDQITGFGEVSITVPHGSTADEILAALPTEVSAWLASGKLVSVPVQWDSVGTINQTTVLAQTVAAAGSYTGSEYTVPETVSLTAAVTIAEAERTSMPTITPGTGVYLGEQEITITADEGATIRYGRMRIPVTTYYIETVDPETGETIRTINPDLDLSPGNWYQTYTGPTTEDGYNANGDLCVTLIYAYAEKDGMRDSNVATVRLEFTSPELTQLAAKDATIAEDGNIACWYSTKTKDGELVPDKYFSDETASHRLHYYREVLIPAFISTSHPAAEGDVVAECLVENEYEPVTFHGFETLGVQAIGTDGTAARVLTVLDARIIPNATDYGYLFDVNEASLNVESAQYRYSCMDPATSNTLHSGEDYCFVTARIGGALLDPDMKACFYVRLENGVDYIYTDAVACEATIDRSAATDNAADNITVPVQDGFYLIGPEGWTVDDIDLNNRFVENPNSPGEYMLETTLAAGDEIKVVHVTNGSIDAWYPDGMDNQYTVDAAHSGEVTVYFKTSWDSAWSEFGGYFYIDRHATQTLTVTIENTLALEGATTLNYFVSKDALDAYELDSFKLVVVHTAFVDGAYVDETVELLEKGELYGNGAYYWFEYKNIAAKELNDRMVAHVEGVKGELSFTSQEKDYNPMTYCYTIAQRETANANLRQTCADLIKYAAAAQEFFNYNTDNPADADWNDDIAAVATQGEPALDNFKESIPLAGQTAEILTYTLDVSGRVNINYYVLPDNSVDYTTLSLVCTYKDVKGNDVTAEIPGTEWNFFNATYGYIATLNTVNAGEMREIITAVVKDANGNVISNTYKTSIETYAKTIVDRDNTPPLIKLMKAMLNYGTSAAAYLG